MARPLKLIPLGRTPPQVLHVHFETAMPQDARRLVWSTSFLASQS